MFLRYNYSEMKPILIAAITLSFIIYFAPRSPGKQAAAQHKNETDKQLSASGRQLHSQTETAASQQRRPEWYKSPEWVLVIVGFVTAIVIGWQSYETMRSASALLASERAWIEGEITENSTVGVKRYAITVRNKGKTPAQILRYEVWYGQTRDNVKLSKSGFKAFNEDVFAFLGSGETKALRDDLDMDTIFAPTPNQSANAEGIPKGAFWVTITYGIIIDGGKRKKKHTTSFAYLYDLTFFAMRRVPEYNDYT